jgi:hypothetical protein
MSATVWTLLVLGGVAAISGAVVALRKASALRRFHRIPEATIAGASTGQVVRLTGSVVAEGEARVSGAYSGTPGVVAVSERWEKTSRGQRLRRLDRSVRATPFILEDPTGRVRVLADEKVEAILDLAVAKVATSGPNRVFGAGVLAANLNDTQETIEGVIAIGQRVMVSGVLHKRDDGTLELAGPPLIIAAT